MQIIKDKQADCIKNYKPIKISYKFIWQWCSSITEKKTREWKTTHIQSY